MRTTLLVILGCCLAVTGCATAHKSAFQTSDSSQPVPWTNLQFQNNPDDFQFAIVSDRNGGNRPGIFPDAIKKLNWLQPEFVMSIGDFIGGYIKDPQEIRAQMDEVDAELAPLDMAFFRVPGNHDLTNPVEIAAWQERYGKLYYHFLYKGALFLCLDTEDPVNAHLSQEQLDYFQKVLAEHPDTRWTFVFMHNPLWAAEGDIEKTIPNTNWDKFEAMLGNRPYTVFAGHWHQYVKFVRNGHAYYVLSTTGGGIDEEDPALGWFDHVVWVTLKNDGPRIANLRLSGILPEDQFTESLNTAMRSLTQGGFSMEADPLFASSGGFKGGATELRLVNNSTVPVHVQSTFRAHPQMLIDPPSLDVTVAPESTSTVPMTLKVLKAVPADRMEMAEADTALTFALPEDHGARTLHSTFLYKILPQLAVRRAANPVTVDGKLDEWKRLPISMTEPAQLQFDKDTWTGPQDSSCRIGMSYDKDYLYIAVDVTDDEMMHTADAYPWEQDAVELRLDAEADPMRSQSHGADEFGKTLLVAIAPGESTAQVFGHDKFPEGLQAASQPTATGYAVEVAIPVAYLNAQQGMPWQAVRLNVALDDYDEDGGAQVWWQPDWRRALTYPGSGTFFRK